MSGQTRADAGADAGRGAASMEGRTIVRPNCSISNGSSRRARRFNGGPDNCPAKPQRPRRRGDDDQGASMEGRTIVRPNPSPGPLRRRSRPASMEGRTIVRPNRPRRRRCCGSGARFNGGPDNCPAKRSGRRPPLMTTASLQWRAGQLSGQTGGGTTGASNSTGGFNGGPDNCPAKPSRKSDATRRAPCFNGGPDNCPAKPTGGHRGAMRACSFNGGPDNCPAKLVAPLNLMFTLVKLQWRAGQLSGQTRLPGLALWPLVRRFNGGPDNCPAKQGHPELSVARRDAASMEGRTIVRPNTARMDDRHPPGRASMEGRTIVRPNANDRGFASTVKGASMEGRTIVRPNDPHRRRRLFAARASMEGRTIVRPNPQQHRTRRVEAEASMEGRTIVRPNWMQADRLDPAGAL